MFLKKHSCYNQDYTSFDIWPQYLIDNGFLYGIIQSCDTYCAETICKSVGVEMFGSVQIIGSNANAQSISPLTILAEVSPSSNLHAIQIQAAH